MYETFYDVTEAIPWSDFAFVAFGLLMVGVGFWMWMVAADRLPERIAEALEKLPRRKPVSKPALRTSSFVVMAFGVLWLLFTGIGIVGSWLSYRAALDSGAHELVEGLVENFEPELRGGNTSESFTVNGVYFSYSASNIRPAFKTSQSRGGPIREGLSVRISYVPGDQNNAILKLEIPTSALATVVEDESIRRPRLPFGLAWSLMAVLGIVLGWLLFFNRDVKLKRRLFPVLLLLGSLLFVLFGLDRGSSPGTVLLVLPVTLFYLWVIRFCNACGATVVPKGSWKRPTVCNRCGHELGTK